jgi:hypothetical protein
MASHHSAQGLASLGRHGDSMLVHMSPHEVAGLQGLAMAQGGSLTINPNTGMPEAFNLGGFFSSFLPTIAGMAFAPATGGASLTTMSGMAPLLAGAATGAGLAAIKGEDPLMGTLMGGLGGYGGGQLAGPLSAAADPAATAASKAFSGIGDTVSNINPSNLMGSTNVTAGLPTTGGMGININNASQAGINQLTGAPGIQWSQAANAVANPEFVNQVATSLPQASLGNAFKGMKNLGGFGDASMSNAYGAYKLAGGTGAQLAMPVGGALLGGLEPTDIYGEPMKPDGKDKYDPYSRLDLSGDTGLRLYAAGGNVTTNQSSIASGGLQGLYGSPDNSGGTQPLSRDGYGVGRLEGLTAAGSQAKAADMFYAQGGPVSFADGGETEGVALDPVSVASDSASPSPGGIAALANSAQMDPQGGQAPTDINLTAPPTATDGSLINQIASNLQADPNYQPKNPIEAAIVKQLKGTDSMQQEQQGLGSLAPAQPSFPAAATFAPAQAMGPTDYSQMNTPYMARGGYLDGQGDGMSDSIPATIEGKQPARLADGEFVVPADVVSHLGNGSSKAGSKRLYAMLAKVRHARTGNKKQGREINPNKYLPA